MRRSLLFIAVATTPLAAVAFLANRPAAADQPDNPPKKVAAPQAATNDAGPRPVAPKDAPPGGVAPKEAPPARPTTENPPSATPRDPREAPRDPREVPRDPRDVRPATRDPRAAAPDPRATREVRREKRRTDRDLGLTFGRVNERGLAVSQLAATSALYKSGLRTGDYIVSVNGHRLERADDFDRYVYDGDANARIKVIVFRGGREEVVYLEPTVFYADDASYNDDYAYFGVTFDDRYPDRLIVRNVIPNTAAYAAGLRDGDEITTWHGARIANPRDFGLALHSIYGGTVDFEFVHDSKPVRAEARFATREAARPVENRTAPAPGAREPAPTAPAPTAPAPTAPPAVTPNLPAGPAPVPVPGVNPQPPRRPGLLRDR